MGANSKIEWCDHTFNPWRGCTKVAAGCANCYAERQSKRFPDKLGIWGDDGTRVIAAESTWEEPEKWNKAAAKSGAFARVFCASLADVFEEWTGQMQWPDGTPAINRFSETPYLLANARARLFSLIDATPHLTWMLLTKRPQNILRLWPEFGANAVERFADGTIANPYGHYRNNVWLGTSISTQEDANRNIPELLKCNELAPVLFVIAEPLIEAVDLTRIVIKPASPEERARGKPDLSFNAFRAWAYGKGEMPASIDWLICGGESGHHARPMHPQWARSLRDQCIAAGVPFFFKQWGEWGPLASVVKEGTPFEESSIRNAMKHVCERGEHLYRIGKQRAGRELDGRTWDELPAATGVHA